MDAVSHKAGLPRLPVWAAVFVVLVCFAIVVSTGWTEWVSRENELRNAEVQLGNIVHSLRQHADDTVELAESVLTGIVTGLEADSANPARIARLQSILNVRKPRLGRIRGLFVYDEGGRWLATTEAVNLADYNNSDRDYFRHHRDTDDRAMLIGRPVRSKSSGQWVMTLSRRWNHPDGRFAGVVAATVESAYFSKFYAQFDIGPSGAISLQSADGVTLAHSQDDGTAIGRDRPGRFFQTLPAGAASGSLHFQSAQDGLQRLGYFQRSDRYPLVVLASKTQADVLARWDSDARVRLSLVICLVVLIAGIGVFLVRQLLRGQQLASALAENESSFRMLAEGSSDMVMRIGKDERIEYVAPSSVRILGWRPDQLLGQRALAGINPLDAPYVQEMFASLKRGDAEEARGTFRTRCRNGSEIWVESTLRVSRKSDGAIEGFIVVTRDVTQQKTLQGRLEILAIEDGLTGLANRRRFDERLREEWSRAYRERTSMALLMIDVDHFKAFNDAYGHPAGDECLHTIAGILADEALRSTDLAARYGGEEFAMLLPNTDAEGCARIGERIRRALREVAIAHGRNLPSGIVTASLGGAVCRPGAERSAGPASLVDAADRALYAAKDGGRDRLVMAAEVVSLPAAVPAGAMA